MQPSLLTPPCGVHGTRQIPGFTILKYVIVCISTILAITKKNVRETRTKKGLERALVTPWWYLVCGACVSKILE